MNKFRLEFLSDGIFAIVMTLLVIEIKVPELHGSFSEEKLLHSLQDILPLFFAYFLSFCLLITYWTIHNFLFTVMAKNTTRVLNNFNFLFLAFICLVPFSAHFLGSYPTSPVSVMFYSINVLINALILLATREYIIRSKEVENVEIKLIDKFYGTVRILGTVGFAVLAILLSFYNTYLSIGLLLFNVAINLIPGALAFLLRITKLDSKVMMKEIQKI